MGISIKSFGKAGVGAAMVLVAYLLLGVFVHAETAPSISTSIRNNTDLNTVISSANIGASVRNVAKVASSTGPIPQGSVNFNVYNNTSCSGSPAVTEGGVNLLNGFATSSAYTLGASGLSFKVHYNHDVNNIDADSDCASVTATQNATTITNSLSATTIAAGGSVYGIAALGGATSNASGTVAYSVYSNSGCTTPYGGAGSVTVTNAAVPNSPPFQFVTPGTYYWQAVYSGDSSNSAATSTCSTTALTVQAAQGKNSPTISTTLSSSSVLVGTNVYDSATLTGETANASGTVQYKVYTNNSCTSLFANAGTKTVTNGAVQNSDNVTFGTVGTFYWQAVYSGDSLNNPATSTCTSEMLTVSASGTTPPPAGASTISGTVFNDKNKNGSRDSGEEGLAGFNINLYNSANFNNGKYDPVYKTAITDSNGNYSFTALANGTYSIEQLKKTGWKQKTDDYKSVVLANGAGMSGKDFGDVQKKNDDPKNNGKHKKDCKDDDDDNSPSGNSSQSSSTKSWWRNFSDNGNHFGWFKGNGKSNSGKNQKDD